MFVIQTWTSYVLVFLIVGIGPQIAFRALKALEFFWGGTVTRLISWLFILMTRYTHRRRLWSNLVMHKQLVRQRPWCLLGDFNAALFLDDMAAGSSSIDIAKREFKQCVDEIEVSDLQQSGLKFTWNQKPKGNERILKKLDRVLANIEFIDMCQGAHAIFQPYRMSDHAPAVLKIPWTILKKPRPFKFYNILVSNARFKEVVSNCWNTPVSGFHTLTTPETHSAATQFWGCYMVSYASMINSDQKVKKKINFRSLHNSEQVAASDCVLPMAAMDAIKHKFDNTLVGFFVGKKVAFTLVKNYVVNTWGKFGFQNVIRDDDGFHFFKFASSSSVEKVIEQGPWMIRGTPIILTKWSPSLTISRDEVTRVPVWVKLHRVPVVAYSEDGLSIIATQIGMPITLDAFTSDMCVNPWGRIGFARALIVFLLRNDLKKEVILAVPLEDGKGHTNVTIKVEYEWKPPLCLDCHCFGHDGVNCPKKIVAKVSKVSEHEQAAKENDDGFVTVTNKKKKGKSIENPHNRQIEGIKFNKPKSSFVYRPKKASSNTTSDSNQPSSSKESSDAPINLVDLNVPTESVVKLKNSFDALNEDEMVTNDSGQNSISIINESDSEDIDEEITMEEQQGDDRMNTRGQALPLIQFLMCSIASWNIRGLNFSPKQREVKQVIFENQLSVCAILESHVRDSNLDNVIIVDMAAGSSSIDIAMREFKQCVNEIEFSDLQQSGLKFTWNQKPKGNEGVLKKLDCVLIFKDCKELLEKVQIRVDDCKNKSLSIAGRLQLVKSVLGSLHVFWASVFMLPTRILLDIEQIMRGFLWCQGKLGGGKAKVAWNVVCLPMDEGGLGIRRLDDFNKALMTTQVWKLLVRKESLWVEWIHVYKLRGRSFWDIPYRGNMTWGWRNVLKLRPLIREFIWKKLGNGLTTSVWFDRWCIQSPLADLISSRDIFREGFNKETKVCDLVINGVLDWPTSWLSKYPSLNAIVSPVLVPNSHDLLEWRNEDGLVCSFSAHTVWNTIRARGTKVSWYDAVWFSCCIPKHAVHLWLVIRRRLKTQDTLRHWDNMIYALVTCSLCETQPDSHDHLFFECPFSQQVWNQVKGVAGLASSNASIYDIIDDIIPFAARKTSKSVIAKLVVAATSYFIWQERNGRLFKNMKRTVNQVVECIMNTVRLKLMSCRLKKSRSACDIVKAWKLSEGILIS
ncbi:hypothetical protein Tco_1335480 [Tanacetum coccineum]